MLSGSIVRRALFGSPDKDPELEEYTERLNASIGVYAGSSMAILETVMAVASFLSRGSQFTPHKFWSYVIFGACSAAFAVVSYLVLKGSVKRGIYRHFLHTYLILLAGYGVLNSVEDFAAGEQCFTFFVFIMVDVCIFATPPIGILTITACSYLAMYVLAFSGGRLDTGSLVNFWVSSVFVVMSGLVRFHECRIGADHERELRRVGSCDGLTGLKNRMALRADFPNLVGRYQFVAMADLDDFKIINDTHGHEAGDVALMRYGAALQETFPEADIYRYGGDEFLFFVPAGEGDSIDDRLKELRARIGAVTTADGISIVVDTSIGYVLGISHDAVGLRGQMRAADEKLYKVKQARKAGRRQNQADAITARTPKVDQLAVVVGKDQDTAKGRQDKLELEHTIPEP